MSVHLRVVHEQERMERLPKMKKMQADLMVQAKESE